MNAQFLSLTSSNPRHRKALTILLRSGQWSRVTIIAFGALHAYGIPSTADPNIIYISTTTSCTCPDSVERGSHCKHQIAVKLYEIMKGN